MLHPRLQPSRLQPTGPLVYTDTSAVCRCCCHSVWCVWFIRSLPGSGWSVESSRLNCDRSVELCRWSLHRSFILTSPGSGSAQQHSRRRWRRRRRRRKLPRPRLCWLGGAGAAPLRSAAANGTARELRRAVLARCARPAGACAELRSRSLLLFLLLYRRWRWSGVCAFVRCCSGSLLPSQRCLRWWWLGRGAGIWQRHHLSDDEGDSDDDVVAAASASPASYFADTAGEETGSASGIAHAATLCLQGHARARSRLLAVLAGYRSTHTLLDGSQAAVWGWMTARSATTTTARGSFSRLLGSRARQAFAKAQGPRVLTRGASAGGGRRR